MKSEVCCFLVFSIAFATLYRQKDGEQKLVPSIFSQNEKSLTKDTVPFFSMLVDFRISNLSSVLCESVIIKL